jgi:hypothetical protein
MIIVKTVVKTVDGLSKTLLGGFQDEVSDDKT